MQNIKTRLILMNFLEFAVWGAYLISMGTFLKVNYMRDSIGWFYSVQGIVSIFMPTLIGIVADRWIQAQRLLGICHLIAALAMIGLYIICTGANTDIPGAITFEAIFPIYVLSVAFYMPTLALSNSVAYSILDKAQMDIIKVFPPIRVFGTIGFIVAMLLVNLLGEEDAIQFLISAIFGLILSVYSFTLPNIEIKKQDKSDRKSISELFGLNAFSLFKQKKMALFFIFSMLLGICLQITNAFANPYIRSFENIPEFADTFGAKNANALISISQVSETLCILLIPFFLKKFGIKRVMLIAMVCWVLRFALLGLGNPGSGIFLFILSMMVYGMAFDFFNVSGSLFVDKETEPSIRSSAQGLFMLMTNGIGASIGTLGAQCIVNLLVPKENDPILIDNPKLLIDGWQHSWYVFAAYALIVTISFAILFRYKHNPDEMANIKH